MSSTSEKIFNAYCIRTCRRFYLYISIFKICILWAFDESSSDYGFTIGFLIIYVCDWMCHSIYPGGILADKMQPRKALVLSLGLATLLNLAFAALVICIWIHIRHIWLVVLSGS